MNSILFSSPMAAEGGPPGNGAVRFPALGTNGHIGNWVPPLPYSLLTLGQAIAGQAARTAYGSVPTPGAALRRPAAGANLPARASATGPVRGKFQSDASSRIAAASQTQLRPATGLARPSSYNPPKLINPMVVAGSEPGTS